MPDHPLASCLCVTRNRVPLLKRAVACFHDQTYPARELVILYETTDEPTREYVESIQSPSIRGFANPPGLSLGAIRNRSIQHARGRFIAQWDDDDWHGPARLARQIDAVQVSRLPACVLARIILYDVEGAQAYLSEWRTWEGTLVAEKTAMPAYPDVGRNEDTPVVDKIRLGRKLTHIEKPDLYVYTFHGSNTWDRAHFDTMLKGANPLTASATQHVRATLGG